VTVDRALIAARDPNCLRCGRVLSPAGDWSAHHRWLRSQGGPDTPSNVIGLCGTGTTGCHGWAHSHPLLAGIGGWILRANPHPVPAAAPVHCAWRGWILLDNSEFYGWRPYFPDDGAPALPDLSGVLR
jgi:hypothetical protein